MTDTETRDKLVLAAERLFGERGIDNVSLREINRAAGQRNVAALHYHFGTREALLEAIFERRMAGINRRRVALLDAVEAEGRADSIRAVVEAMVLPLAEQLDPAADGGNYVRFLAQAISDPGVDVGGLVRDKFDHGMVRTRRLARRILENLPAEIVDERMDPHKASVAAARLPASTTIGSPSGGCTSTRPLSTRRIECPVSASTSTTNSVPMSTYLTPCGALTV